MPDLSRSVSGFSTISGFAWDARQQKLLFTSNGALNALDPLTGQVVSIPIPGAGSLGDLDITADGRYALVGERNAQHPPAGPNELLEPPGTGFYYRVSLGDGRVDKFSFTLESNYESGGSDVAALPNGTALLATGVAGSGWTNLRILQGFDTSPSVQVHPQGRVSAPAFLEVSESRRFVLVGEGNSSSGPFKLFDASTGTLTSAYLARFPGHPYGDFVGNVDISEKAGLAAISGRDGTLIITDLALKLVKDLSFDFRFNTQGVQFSPDGRHLLVSQSNSDLIAVFDTATWTQLGSYKLQSRLTDDPYSQDGYLSFSADGRFLFVDTSTGIEVLDLSVRTFTPGQGPLGVQRITVVEPFTLAAGQSVAHGGVGYTLVSAQPGPLTLLSIAGNLTVTGDFAAAGVMAEIGDYRQRFVVETAGVIRVTSTGPTSDASGYRVDGFDGASFANHGTIIVNSANWAFGVESYADSGDYVNTGTIRVTGRDLAMGLRLMNLEAPYGFRNSGAIEVHDGGGRFGQSWGVVLPSFTSAFRNEAGGSIVVLHDAAGETRNIAVAIAPDGFIRPQGDVYVNAGLIQGDYALQFSQDSDEEFISYQRVFHNEATGVLRGEVLLSGNGIVLDNAGLVDGPINMGAWSEFYDGSRGGRVTGMVSGGAGDDQMIGGGHFDNFQGNTGNDDLKGGGGDDWVVGGKDNDNLAGDAGADLVYGNLGNDTCDGGDGNDVVRGGQDNDVLRGGTGDDYVSGDKGGDTMAGGVGADVFHTFGEAGMDRVVDFDPRQGDRVQLDPGTQYTVAQVGADTVISMTGGAQMVLIGVQMSTLAPGWIFGA